VLGGRLRYLGTYIHRAKLTNLGQASLESQPQSEPEAISTVADVAQSLNRTGPEWDRQGFVTSTPSLLDDFAHTRSYLRVCD
jgi:hypothetical protein